MGWCFVVRVLSLGCGLLVCGFGVLVGVGGVWFWVEFGMFWGWICVWWFGDLGLSGIV